MQQRCDCIHIHLFFFEKGFIFIYIIHVLNKISVVFLFILIKKFLCKINLVTFIFVYIILCHNRNILLLCGNFYSYGLSLCFDRFPKGF